MAPFSKSGIWTLRGIGALGMLVAVVVLAMAPQRRLDLLDRTVVLTAISDSLEGGYSQSRLVRMARGVACVWKLRPGFRYPWAGIRLEVQPGTGGVVDLSWSQRIRLHLRIDPAANLRFQVLSRDSSVRRTGRMAHAREIDITQEFDTTLDWTEFRIPAWYRDAADKGGDQRLGLLDRVEGLEFQSSYVGDARDSTRLEIFAIEALGVDRFWRVVALALAATGIAVLLLSFRGRWKIAPAGGALGGMVEGRAPVQLEERRLTLGKEALELLQKRFADPDLSLDSLAAELKLSPRLVAGLLKETTGMHFKASLNELRLAEAARLLRQTKGSISEIGFAVGFQNSSHFGRAFREKFGVAPSKWREDDSAKPAKAS